MPARNNLSRVLKEKGITIEEMVSNIDIPLNNIDEVTEIYLGRKDFTPEILTIIAQFLQVKEEELLSYRRRRMYQNIGSQLRQIREEKDFTLVELGKQSGVSYTHISEIERGKTCPSIKTLEKLSKVLNISSSDFLQTESTLTLGEKIRRLREKQNDTQSQLAEKVGVSLSLIGQIETGRAKPALDTLQKISNIFGVSIGYFLLAEGDEKFSKSNFITNSSHDKIHELVQEISPDDVVLIIDMIKLLKNHDKVVVKSEAVHPYIEEITDIMQNLKDDDKKFVIDNARWVFNKYKNNNKSQENEYVNK